MSSINESEVLCPSVFGVYPAMPVLVSPCFVDVSGVGSPLSVHISHLSRWDGQRFSISFTVTHGGSEVSAQYQGGATSLRSLSQLLLSRCMRMKLPELIQDRVDVAALADFIFDQLVCDVARGSVRQAYGVMGAPWLSVSGLQEEALLLESPSLLLGRVLQHPAAFMAQRWASKEPLGGVLGQVSLRFARLLSDAEPHFKAKGVMVLGPSISKGRLRGKLDALPAYGWVLTGRREGVESLARERARRMGRPLLVVSRQEDVASILPESVFQCVIVDQRSAKLGSFRDKLLASVKHLGLENKRQQRFASA